MRMKMLVIKSAIAAITCLALPAGATMSTYFNNPPNANYIDLRVAEVIDGASSYCYVAIYALNQSRIVNSLVSAKQRGVDVRIVTDTDYRYKSGYQASYDLLASYGIPIICDGRSALMHHKFIVVDGTKVVSGSYNFTDEQTTVDKNNVIIFSGSSSLATRFKNEFLQMYSGKFGSNKTDYSGTDTVDGSTVYTYFSPKAAVRSALNSHIATANTSIYFNIFTFTDASMKDAMVARKNAGVTVKGTFDAWQATSQYSQYTNMKNAGCQVRKDTYSGLLHDKFMAIDGGTSSSPRAVTGSFNWTASADDSNDENCLVILNSTVANSYKGNAVYVYTYKAK